jgi:hypothetical protein
MGANPTQAQAVVLFLVAFTLIAAGLAADVNVILMLLGLASLAAAIVLFLRCKPWEHREE